MTSGGAAVDQTLKARKKVSPPQGLRALFASVYIVILLSVAAKATGIPRLDSTGIWFWSGVVLIILGSALIEPFFPTPADAVANATAAILTAIAFPSAQEAAALFGIHGSALALGRGLVVGYGVLVASLGLAVIAVRKEKGSPQNEGAAVVLMNKAVRSLGSARAVYSIVFLASAFATFEHDPYRLATIWVMWLIVVIVRPFEWLYRNLQQVVERNPSGAPQIKVVGMRNPGLVELESPDTKLLKPGCLVKVESAELEILHVARSMVGTWALAGLRSGVLPAFGSTGYRVGQASDPAIGYVDNGTDLRTLRFSVPATDDELTYGDVVTADSNGAAILYQIIEARIQSEIIEPDVTHSRFVVDAAKLGSWDSDRHRFVPNNWLPAPGCAVRRPAASSQTVSKASIGYVPGTAFAVEVDISMLVTHSTAVLGVLGSGKSTLARELMLRAAREQCRILVIDTTPEHANALKEFIGEEPGEIAHRVNAGIADALENRAQSPDLGGNRREFGNSIEEDVRAFLDSAELMRVYDLTKFKVHKQLGWKDKSGNADLADCTLPELTALIWEAVFRVLAAKGFTSSPRLWIVLEEGHHLIPETYSVSSKDDDKAVQRTAKIFLQGRKFGLGALLITQRTANVSKSLLTQCNTIFCFRAHDDTTANFLKDRAGASHVAGLPNLIDRRVLAFGRGIRSEDPLFIQVNDPAAIRAALFPMNSDPTDDEGETRAFAAGSADVIRTPSEPEEGEPSEPEAEPEEGEPGEPEEIDPWDEIEPEEIDPWDEIEPGEPEESEPWDPHYAAWGYAEDWEAEQTES
jgi:hypothetical protein